MEFNNMIILSVQVADTISKKGESVLQEISNNQGINENLLNLEKIILLVFFILQIYFFFKILRDIKILKNAFKGKIEILKNEEDIPKISNDKKNRIFDRIKDAVNKYLTNNFRSAVNFGIIQDTINREVDLEDEGIQQNISVPLYIGLAATMLGIILGLWAMPDFSSKDFTESIGVLISGVKWAMTTSLVGLTLTTILSVWLYKPFVQEMLKDKSLFLSQLQAELLPEMTKADESGYIGLKNSLENFSANAETIAQGILHAVNKSRENIEAQERLIQRVDDIDIKKVSQTNLLLFKRIEDNLETLDELYEHLAQMERISENLKSFAYQTNDITRIGQTLQENFEMSKELTRFATEHLRKYEEIGSQSISAITYFDSHFKGAVNSLKESLNKQLSDLNSITTRSESELLDLFSNINRELGEKTREFINNINKAYEGKVPDFSVFEKLEKLDELKYIKQLLNEHKTLESQLLNKMDALINETRRKKERTRTKNSSLNLKTKDIEEDKRSIYNIYIKPFFKKKSKK